MNWYLDVLKKYAVFEGRARRTEYWMFTLFSVVISVVLIAIDYGAGTEYLDLVYSLAVLIPTIAVTVRRLHDTDRSGWWMLILLVPLIGAIALLVFMCLDGTQGNNQYGPNPKG